MKFTEGYWEKNERANALYAVQVCDVEEIPNGMRMLAPFKPIKSRADALDVGALTLEFVFEEDDILKVKYTHF